MEIKNKVKSLNTCNQQTFLSWKFNELKDKKRDTTKLENAIVKGGFSFPVVVWQDYVIDGTERKQAVENLIQKGYNFPEIPYIEIEAKDMQEAKQKALEVSSSFGKVSKESFELFTEDLDLDFDTFEINGITEELILTPEDKEDLVPSLPHAGSKTKSGDIYEIGGHRLLCGDSTKVGDLEILMNGRKADLIVTDPPYNVNYEGSNGLKIENDSMSDSSFLDFLTDAFTGMTKFLKNGGSFYIWHADSEGFNFRKACKDAGLLIKQCIIWNKNTLVMGRQDYQWKHEPCLYGWKEGASHNFYGARDKTTVHTIPSDDLKAFEWFKKQLRMQEARDTSVIDFDKPNKNKEHPTMKPIELLEKQVVNSSKSEDIVLDPFLGSGSTLIACEKTGRYCYGMELDEKYCDVIVQRYVNYTENPKVILNGEDVSHLWIKE